MPRTLDVIIHPPSVTSMIHRWQQPADGHRESNQRRMVGQCTFSNYTMGLDVLRGPSTAAETLALVC
ncbi:hypothetical protein CaCOL14_002968 [Colletotrichum acutatum]